MVGLKIFFLLIQNLLNWTNGKNSFPPESTSFFNFSKVWNFGKVPKFPQNSLLTQD